MKHYQVINEPVKAVFYNGENLDEVKEMIQVTFTIEDIMVLAGSVTMKLVLRSGYRLRIEDHIAFSPNKWIVERNYQTPFVMSKEAFKQTYEELM